MKPNRSISESTGILLTTLLIIFFSCADHYDQAGDILGETGVKGGLVVHIGATDGRLTSAFYANERYLVQGLSRHENSVDRARSYIQEEGLYGKVSVDHLNGDDLPYVDNLVNLLVVSQGELGGITRDEIERVLAPNGVAYIENDGEWENLVKPWPDDIDQWTHYMYDSKGGFRSKDKHAGLPRGIQWDDGPKWARHHDHTASMHAMVSANGRNFSVMDEGPIESIQLPANFVLTARDAFNGVVLWKHELDNWYNHLFPLKSGPGWMPRRLVAVGDEVYFSPGIGQNLLKLNAATGDVLYEYENTATTFELIVSEGIIFASVDPCKEFPDYNQQDPHCWNERDRASEKWAWTRDKEMRYLKAFDSESNELLWEKEINVTPMTMVANDEIVCVHDGMNMLAFNRETGVRLWETSVYNMDEVRTGYSGPRVIIDNNYVVFAPVDKLLVLSAENGEILWTEDEKPRSGHFSLEDIYMIDDKVWVMGRGNHGEFTTYDLASGQEVDFFSNPIESFYIHQRCYPGRATDNYLLPPMQGNTIFDRDTEEWEINHWVRGGCIYGIMPANGMMYTPPHPCACYYQSSMTGFSAITPQERPARNIPGSRRLHKGPAYGQADGGKEYSESWWPVYRQNNERTGYVKTRVSSSISPSWKIRVGDNLSQPTVSGGRVFVSAVDQHTVYAFDADSGSELWRFTTGGRVDSPPTIYGGMAVFGSSDGYVYAVRVEDGELVWRYLAAPEDTKIVSYGQLESVWPIHGSVLIQDNKLYCVAGRNMFLDGGLHMSILDPETGELISQEVMDRTVPGTGQDLQELLMGKHMPVANNDILSGDGTYVYMKSQTFDRDGKRVRILPHRPDYQYGDEVHLFAPSGFLDKTWFQRTYWVYGRAAGEGWAEFQFVPKRVPYGRIMSIDEDNAYSYGRLPELVANTSISEYRLFSAGKEPARKVGIPRMEGDWSEAEFPEGWTPTVTRPGPVHITSLDVEDPLAPNTVDWTTLAARPREELSALSYNWEIRQPDIIARAMVLADDKLFVAGPMDVFDEIEMWGLSNEEIYKERSHEQLEWLQGEHGSFIWVMSKEDGNILEQYEVDYMPAHDGLIAANGRLYMVTEGGEIICYK